MPSYSRGIVAAVAIGVVIVVSIGLSVYYLNPASGFVHPTTANTFVPISTTTADFPCDMSNATSPSFPSILVDSSIVNMSISPAASLRAASCSYTYTKVTSWVAPGGLAGPTGSDAYLFSYNLNVNFSVSNSLGSRNLTLYSQYGMTGLFPKGGYLIYVNSQRMTFVSNPPCYFYPNTVIKNCFAPETTSITIPLPAPLENGEYHLVINSTDGEVP